MQCVVLAWGKGEEFKWQKIQVGFFDVVPRLIFFLILSESRWRKLLSQSLIVVGFGGVGFGRDGGVYCVSFTSLMRSGDWSLHMHGVFGEVVLSSCREIGFA